MKLKYLFILLLPFIFLVKGCGIYSFTGATPLADVKSVSVQFFENRAPIVVPSLSQQFTEALKNKIISSTNLSLEREEGDVQFEGSITGYDIRPTALSGNQTASQNRLTITVSVKFINKKDDKQNFESTFSRFADFAANRPVQQVEQELIRQINSQLVDDIFNRVFINW